MFWQTILYYASQKRLRINQTKSWWSSKYTIFRNLEVTAAKHLITNLYKNVILLYKLKLSLKHNPEKISWKYMGIIVFFISQYTMLCCVLWMTHIYWNLYWWWAPPVCIQLLLIDRLRSERVYINGHIRLNELIRGAASGHAECREIEYERFKETVNKNFALQMNCTLKYHDNIVAVMHNSNTAQTLASVDCKPLINNRMVCSPCKKLRRLLQRLARDEHRKPEDAATATDVVEKEHASEVSEMRQRINNPVCKWFECEAGRFEDIRELNYHVSTHIPKLLNLAPIDRVYICQWGGCNVKKSKRKELVQHIKLMHSGKFRHKQWK